MPPATALLTGPESPCEPPRLGLVALATDMTLEQDLRSLLPAALPLHVTRLAFTNPTTPENLRAMGPGIAAAADLLVPGVALSAIAFGCTSGSVVIGDETVSAAIRSVRPGTPVCLPAASAVAGFARLGVSRVALLTPYVEQTTAPVAAYFRGAGIELVHTHGLAMEDDRDIARLSAPALREAVRRADHPRAEAIFVSCTSTPVLSLIPGLEAELGKPVLSSNQALGWAMLNAAGVSAPGPGRLFAPLAGAA